MDAPFESKDPTPAFSNSFIQMDSVVDQELLNKLNSSHSISYLIRLTTTTDDLFPNAVDFLTEQLMHDPRWLFLCPGIFPFKYLLTISELADEKRKELFRTIICKTALEFLVHEGEVFVASPINNHSVVGLLAYLAPGKQFYLPLSTQFWSFVSSLWTGT